MSTYWMFIHNSNDVYCRFAACDSKVGECRVANESQPADKIAKIECGHRIAMAMDRPTPKNPITEIQTGTITEVQKNSVHTTFVFSATSRILLKNLNDMRGGDVSEPQKYDQQTCKPDWIKRVFHCEEPCQCEGECKNK